MRKCKESFPRIVTVKHFYFHVEAELPNMQISSMMSTKFHLWIIVRKQSPFINIENYWVMCLFPTKMFYVFGSYGMTFTPLK